MCPRRASPQDDVPLVRECPLGLRRLEVEARDEKLTCARIAHRVEDRVVREERVAGEVHLRHQALVEGAAEQREVDVRRPPRVRVIPPRVCAGLDRREAVPALAVGEAAAGAGEVRIEWCRMPVDLMAVAPGCVGLPHLDERASQRASVLVDDASVDEDALAERLPLVLAREVVVRRREDVLAEDGPVEAMELLGERRERPLRRAPPVER